MPKKLKVFNSITNGVDIKIASAFPLVFKPNVVPLSYSKLNSTYLLLLKNNFLDVLNKLILISFNYISKERAKKFPVSTVKFKFFTFFASK